MGINLGQTPTKAVYLGQTAVKSVFFGSQRVWGGEEPAPTAEPLCFTLESSTFTETISLNKNGSPDSISIEYSTDGSTWSDYTWDGSTGLAIQLASNGDKVYFRAKNENPTIGSNSGNYYQFSATGWNGVVRISGNVQTLLKADGTRTDAPAWCYYYLFAGRPDWKSAPELPATTLGQYCYASMFWVSTGLTAAPALPATTLADYCYQNMFYGCSSLTTAPALPATTLNQYCYRNMFQNCTSLTAAPELPAQTITAGVYNGMFRGCTSLTDAPELPAATLVYDCYTDMFNGCSSLSSVEVAFTVWTSASTTPDWLKNVAASGEFACPVALPDVRGASNIPTGWTAVKPAATKSLKFTALQPNSTVVLSAAGSPGGQYVYSTDGYGWQSYALGDSIALANEGDSVWFKAAQSNRGITYQDYVGFNGSGLVAAEGWPEAMTEPEEANWTSASYANSYYALFYKCQNLADLVVRGEFQNASPVHPFGQFARECPVLSSIVFPDVLSASGQTSWAGSGDGLFTNAFCKDPQLLRVEFPKLEFAKSIALWAACEYDPALLSVEFPSMTSAWNDAFFGIFNGMTGVPKVVVLSAFESVPGLLQNSGEGWKTLNSETSVVIPDALYDTWTTTSYWSSLGVTYVKASEFSSAGPLRFTALAANSSVSLVHGGGDTSFTAPSLEYSTDGQSWSAYQLGQAVPLQSEGDYVMMRATAPNAFSTSRTNYFTFDLTGQVRASGDATTLLDPGGSVASAPDLVFHKLFYGCSQLKDAADLVLPSLSVGQESYNNMFHDTGIFAAPGLPATTLGANCYGNMFQGCGSLVEASDLPARQLVQYCYQGMYQDCSSLRDGPRIMATGSAGANQLDYMFYQTRSLSSVEVHFTSWSGIGTHQWMQSVQTTSGEFRCPAELPVARGTGAIPYNWTKVDVA